jgi:type IV secretory pathway TraG/TraD family ATPase VirD4
MIYSWLEEVYKRGDKAIVWDVKGTFIQSFVGRDGVDLLAAWDQRSMVWSPGEDIKNHLDCQQMAEIIIPRNPREIQQHFPDSARQVLEAVLIYLDAKGNAWGWADLWEIIGAGRKELSRLLASFPDGRGAASLIEGDSGRSSAEDVYSTLMAHTQKTIRWFAKAWPAEGGQSIRKWVHSDSKFLILGGIPERAEFANATANMAIPLIVNEILSLEDDPNRRIWLFLDELATLGKIDALLQAFSLGRSKGLCVVAGIQDMGKIEHHYSPMLAKSISNTFGTKIFLRCSDVGTSQWASKVLGEQDIYERQVSEGESSEGMFSKKIKTTTAQDVLRTRVMFTPTEIANFNNLEGVLQVSGWPLIRFWWDYQPIAQKVRLFEPASWVSQKASLSDPRPSGKSEGKQWRLDS